MHIYITSYDKKIFSNYGKVILLLCNKVMFSDITNRNMIMRDKFISFIFPDEIQFEKWIYEEKFKQDTGHFQYFPELSNDSFIEKEIDGKTYFVYDLLDLDSPNFPTEKSIKGLIDKIAKLQFETQQNASEKGSEDQVFGTYHALETYKMPLYYAWEAYDYGYHKDLSDIKDDPLMSFSIFESDMIGITKSLISLLKTKKSPIYKFTSDSSLPEDLISIYSRFIDDLEEGYINF